MKLTVTLVLFAAHFVHAQPSMSAAPPTSLSAACKKYETMFFGPQMTEYQRLAREYFERERLAEEQEAEMVNTLTQIYAKLNEHPIVRKLQRLKREEAKDLRLTPEERSQIETIMRQEFAKLHGMGAGWNPFQTRTDTRTYPQGVRSNRPLTEVSDAVTGNSHKVMNRMLIFNNHESIAWVDIYTYFPNDPDKVHAPNRQITLELETGHIRWDGGGVDFERNYPDYVSYLLGERQRAPIQKIDANCVEELKACSLNLSTSITNELKAATPSPSGRSRGQRGGPATRPGAGRP